MSHSFVNGITIDDRDLQKWDTIDASFSTDELGEKNPSLSGSSFSTFVTIFPTTIRTDGEKPKAWFSHLSDWDHRFPDGLIHLSCILGQHQSSLAKIEIISEFWEHFS